MQLKEVSKGAKYAGVLSVQGIALKLLTPPPFSAPHPRSYQYNFLTAAALRSFLKNIFIDYIVICVVRHLVFQKKKALVAHISG